MTIEEKEKIAKKFYDELELTNYTLNSERDDEINADFVWVTDMKEPVGLIIGDNGDYLLCHLDHGYDYWKEEYKKGARTSNETDDSLKLSNGKYAEDIETKVLYDDLRKRMDEYNAKVLNGEKTDADLSDFANEYINNFHDKELEEKLNKIDENMKQNDNINNEANELISKINDRLGIDDSNKTLNELLNEIDKRLVELNMKETDNNYIIDSQNNFYKNKDSDLIWWIENPDMVGEHLFTFDKKKIFNLFKDYPYSLTSEQKEIFDRENPYWANFFKDRQ